MHRLSPQHPQAGQPHCGGSSPAFAAIARYTFAALACVVGFALAKPASAAINEPAAGPAAPGDAQAERSGDQAEAPADFPVRLVPVRLPLTGRDDLLLKGTVQRAVDQLTETPTKDGSRPVLVLQFTPDPRAALPDGRGSEFERALALARFLVSEQLAAVKTVAFAPQTIKGHAVLVAMACEEIAMAPDAEIGEAAADESPDRPLEPFIIKTYREIAESRRTVPAGIAVGWVDRSAEVLRVESEDRIDLVLRPELAAIEAERTILSQDLLVPAGVLGLQTGRQGRELGFVKYLTADREALARVLRVPPAALEESLSLQAEWRPVLIDLQGPITARMVRRISTLIGREIDEQNVNWIGLRIDSGGGDLDLCRQLATTLAELDSSEVRTVAYLPGEATGGAALVALACDQLVMQPGANLGGGFTSTEPVAPIAKPLADKPADARKLPPKQDEQPAEQADDQPAPAGDEDAADPAADAERAKIDAAVISIQTSLAEKTDYTASLLAAMIDPDLRVYRYTNQETAAVRYFSQDEAAEQPDADRWRRGEEITRPGESLRLDAEQAEELGIAWRVVDTFDDLKRLYGFSGNVRVATPSWALEFVEALASPQLAMLLLMIAFIGVYVELNMPGVGVGGFIAAVAFMLFFWSKFTAQTADWLEVMLFITGVLCILLELLVLPGVGVFGFGGALLVLASLVLASQTFLIPKTESQLAELRTSLATIAGSFAAMIVAGIVLRRYLPHTPLFRRMQLAPATGADRIDLENRESVADYAHLVGRTGVATTNLLPSGRAEIDGELVDVIADGDIIDRGATVEVVSARASRVLVRQVSG